MTTRLVMVALMGFSVGSLPHDGALWAAIKLVFTLVLLVLMIILARREQA